MKTIFFCGHKSPYGLAHLKPLLQSNFNIVGVVLATDKIWSVFREKLSGKNYYLYSSCKQKIKMIVKKLIPQSVLSKLKKDYERSIDAENILKEYRVPFWYLDNVNSEEFIQKVKKMQPDLIISAAYPQIFSRGLILIPIQGAVNSHPSLLPKFRGAHPHFWAIVKGEKESGLTAHFMTQHIDNGHIIAQIKFPIQDYNYKQLYEKIVMETPNFVKKIEDFFLRGKVNPAKQDSSDVSYFRNDREIHHRIFWNIYRAKDILNLVRGGNAFCFFRTRKIIIEECFVTETNRNLTNDIEVENGIIVDLGKNSIVIKANSGIVNITKVRYRSRKMEVSKFITKHRILVGERFD